jgi:hypothetical protein
MAIELESKVALDEERDGQPVYFVIIRKAEGSFAFEFRDSCGRAVDATPLTSWDFLDIGEALAWYSQMFTEE